MAWGSVLLLRTRCSRARERERQACRLHLLRAGSRGNSRYRRTFIRADARQLWLECGLEDRHGNYVG